MLRNNKRFSDVNARKIFRLRQFFHLPTKEVGEHLPIKGFFTPIPNEQLADLLVDTMDALAKARRNPIPALSTKSIELIKNAFQVEPTVPPVSKPAPAPSFFASLFGRK